MSHSYAFDHNLKPEDQRQREIFSLENQKFGAQKTDHQLTILYSEANEWEKGVIEPVSKRDFHLDSVTFHYGQQIFEGMKAYRNKDGIYLFRHLLADFACQRSQMSFFWNR